MISAHQQQQQRKCAYCGGGSKLTKEHIWPASIIRKVGDRASYNPKAGKFLWTEMVIGDVCGTCNNGPLSQLDAYGAELYDKYFCNYHLTDKPLNFEYDYNRLARWLLKLSYNAARVNESDHASLARYSKCILDENENIPEDFSISVDLVLPEINLLNNQQVLPASNRICKVKFTEQIDSWCTVRMVAINSFYFWILIQEVPDDQVNIEDARAVLSHIPGTALDVNKKSVNLKSSGWGVLASHAGLVEIVRDTKLPDRK